MAGIAVVAIILGGLFILFCCLKFDTSHTIYPYQ